MMMMMENGMGRWVFDGKRVRKRRYDYTKQKNNRGKRYMQDWKIIIYQ